MLEYVGMLDVQAKLRTSLRDLDTFQSVIQIDNASGIEINRCMVVQTGRMGS
jgi:hypothetical protein